MRIVGLLSWYDEDPAWLAECVSSAARLCDHLIAVDGPYALFPGSTRKPFSGSEQGDVIARTCAGAGIGCTIHASRQTWWGGEVEKRDFMFRVGSTITTPRDWYLRIDADEALTQVPDDTRTLLAATDLDVAEVTLWEREASAAAASLTASADYETPLRCLYRALPGLRIEQAHYVVTAPTSEGRTVLRGDTSVHTEAPALPLWDVRLEHRSRRRGLSRLRLKHQYQQAVEDLAVEQVSPFKEEVAHGRS